MAPLTYSGVPKAGRAGAHVHVRGERAVDHRRAGPDDLRERHEEERLGVLLRDRAGERHDAHRAGQGERGGHDRLAVERHLDEAVAHRTVQAQRRVGVDDGHHARLAQQRVAIHAADDAHDVQRVVHDHGPEAEPLPGLVQFGRERPVHVEMAGLDRQVVGFDRSPTLLVDDVERADEPDVVAEVGEVAGPASAIQVVGEGRTADRREHEVAAAEDDVPLRVPRVERELAGRGRDQRLDVGRVQAHLPGASVHHRAGSGERVQGSVAQDLHADLGQDPQRREVDRLDLVVRQDPERLERIDEAAPRQLLDARRGPARAAMRSGAGRAQGIARVHRGMLRRGSMDACRGPVA